MQKIPANPSFEEILFLDGNISSETQGYQVETGDATKEIKVSEREGKEWQNRTYKTGTCKKTRFSKKLDLNEVMCETEQNLLKQFLLEIRQTRKECKGKEYQPGSLHNDRNGLWRYFHERQSLSSPDNFYIDKDSGQEFKEIASMSSVKLKDLQQAKCYSSTGQPRYKLLMSDATGLHRPRALLHLV